MDDLISRLVAIEAIKQATIHSEDERLAVEALVEVPSAQINPTQIAVNLAEYTHEEIERLKRISDNTPITLLPSAQPGIIRCKDCRWWDKYSETQGYCMAAKHGYYSSHWEIRIRRTYGEDFFCADAEPIEEDEDDEGDE